MTKEPFIYKSSLLDKYLRGLSRADKRAAAAAARAEQIIRASARDGLASLETVNKLTRHGELRIDHCLKYDLGSGYRLVSLKQGRAWYFVFAGSHDACDRWLENQRGSNINFVSAVPVLSDDHAEEVMEEICFPHSEGAIDEYEEQLTARLDDKALRQLFRGICARRG